MANAQINLQVDSHIDLLLINGKEPEVDYYPLEGNHLLPNGENQIVFRYVYTFEQQGMQELVESDIIIARFSADYTELRIESEDYKTPQEARLHTGDLHWTIIDVPTRQTIRVVEDRLKSKPFALNRDYTMEMYNYNLSGAPAAVADLASDDIMTAPKLNSYSVAPDNHQQEKPAKTGYGDAALQLLYEQADNDTKKKFKQYVNEH